MKVLFAVLAVGVLSLAGVGCQDKHHMKSSDPQTMSADVCSHCPGVQTLKADGTCSGCGMKVK